MWMIVSLILYLCCISFLVLHVLDKIQSQRNPTHDPVITSETNQLVTKSFTNSLQSLPVSKHDTIDNSVHRTNGPILSGYIPNPPVRNTLKVSIPSSKQSLSRSRRSTQSAAEQLGVKSPPPVRVNGGINLFFIFLACFLFIICSFLCWFLPSLLVVLFLPWLKWNTCNHAGMGFLLCVIIHSSNIKAKCNVKPVYLLMIIVRPTFGSSPHLLYWWFLVHLCPSMILLSSSLSNKKI